MFQTFIKECKFFLSKSPHVRPSLHEFKKILTTTFIYISILINNYMKSTIICPQFFYFINYDLKGHWRSQKVTFMFKNQLFVRYLFCVKSDLIKNLNEWEHYKDAIFFHLQSLPSKVIEGHKVISIFENKLFLDIFFLQNLI